MGTGTLSLDAARSLLFVPGHRPERFGKAVASGADAVVIDLEDAVPVQGKAEARVAIAAAWPELRQQAVPVVLRINAPGQRAGDEDLRWLATLRGAPAAVMVPKAESAQSLAAVRASLPDVPLLPLIESAAGHAALTDIAGAPGVMRLVIGHIDFMADTGITASDDEHELAPLRFAVAMATRLHRLAPAIDGVTVRIDDDERLHADTRRALHYGFGAKLCIHPRQIPGVHAALAPSPEALDWARRVVAADQAAGGAAVQLDGRMVDLPVVLQAQRLLKQSGG
jgi:citrate lyase subunit beta/citryl-CoA lyase